MAYAYKNKNRRSIGTEIGIAFIAIGIALIVYGILNFVGFVPP